MIEALTTAVVAALVASTGDAVRTVASDAYSALKGLLSRLAPSFDPDNVDAQVAKEKTKELSEKLAGCSENDLHTLANTTAEFAEANGEAELAKDIKEYAKVIYIKDIEAKKQVSVKLRAYANEPIWTEVERVVTDEDFSFDFDSTQSQRIKSEH